MRYQVKIAFRSELDMHRIQLIIFSFPHFPKIPYLCCCYYFIIIIIVIYLFYRHYLLIINIIVDKNKHK